MVSEQETGRKIERERERGGEREGEREEREREGDIGYGVLEGHGAKDKYNLCWLDLFITVITGPPESAEKMMNA